MPLKIKPDTMYPVAKQRTDGEPDPIHNKHKGKEKATESFAQKSDQVQAGKFSTQPEADAQALDYNRQVVDRGVFPGSLGPDALASIEKARNSSPGCIAYSLDCTPEKSVVGRVLQEDPGGAKWDGETPKTFREGNGY